MSIEEYSVSNRGLRPGLVGTGAQVAARVAEFEDAGVNLLLLQSSPQAEEMETLRRRGHSRRHKNTASPAAPSRILPCNRNDNKPTQHIPWLSLAPAKNSTP